jgi:hypothetical protein
MNCLVCRSTTYSLCLSQSANKKSVPLPFAFFLEGLITKCGYPV